MAVVAATKEAEEVGPLEPRRSRLAWATEIDAPFSKIKQKGLFRK